MDTPTKPLQKLKKKDMVAQIANIKSANCFLQTNSPNITLANKYSCTVISIFLLQSIRSYIQLSATQLCMRMGVVIISLIKPVTKLGNYL